MSGELIIRHVIIRGRVQGVGYRAWVERTAAGRSLQGWVRNCRDGAVEAVFAGTPDAVAAFVEACWHGPFNAQVEAIDERDAATDLLAKRHAGESFSVLWTA